MNIPKVKCECAICRNSRNFDLPQDIIEAAKAGELVIFAGAGVSTESKNVFKFTLYEDIKSALKIDAKEDVSFSELMSEYCKQPNGRQKLLRKIKERIDYVNGFPELYRGATRFHSELATIHQITEIVTTNWDDLFEKECGAVPIVTPEDLVFWKNPERKVLKIHGSINNFGSIIATKEDYDNCYETLEKGVIGGTLKNLLATKCVIFIGYSFGDEDFNEIHNSLIKEMKGLNPHAYIVTIDENAHDKFRDYDITPIITDASYFIHNLKRHLISKGVMLEDENFKTVFRVMENIKKEHMKLCSTVNVREQPEMIYTLSYQDGLIHSLERILNMNKTGEYSDPEKLVKMIHSYHDILQEKEHISNYYDASYVDGYINGLILLLSTDESESLPVYYVYGYDGDIVEFDEFVEVAKEAESIHPEAYNQALQFVKENVGENDIAIHHIPFL